LALRFSAERRQVIVVTDGFIGFEHEVVGEILRRLPPASRVHTVGVGSAVNRSLTGPAARAGRGVETIVGIGEDAERGALRVVAATAEAVVVDLEVSGAAVLERAPERLPDLFAGAPARVALKLRPEGGAVVVRGRTRTGVWETQVNAPALIGTESGAPAALFGRERVADLEARSAASAGGGDSALEAEIERIGLAFQIATAKTSWVAVREEPSVDPGAPTRKVRVPQALPYGVSVAGLGLRAAGAPPPAAPMMTFAAPMAPAAQGVMARRAASPMRGFGGGAPPPAGRPTLGAKFRVSAGAPAAPSPPRQVRGDVKLRSGAVLSVEVAATADPAPAPAMGSEVTLLWRDGTSSKATVVQGTSLGPATPGDTLRLVLRLTPADVARAEAPSSITIEDGDAPFVIDLSSR
jgi:Ca-activated chloride channel family protein